VRIAREVLARLGWKSAPLPQGKPPRYPPRSCSA
jgi:hypothetical protein